MTINQLSVFLENKAGSLSKILQILKKANIQLISTTIADTVDYGICRIICSEPERAYNVLKEANVAVSESAVFAVELENLPGKAADVIEALSEGNIEISYLYSFLLNGNGILIFRTAKTEEVRKIVAEKHFKLISEQDLLQLAK